MPSRYLTPFGSDRTLSPFAALHREMNRLFDDFMPGEGRAAFFNPDVDVTETDKEIRVCVDLPGVEEKDVDVRLEDDLLVIRGEKHAERTEEKEDRRFSERSFGSFQRALRLPVRIDPDKIRADFHNGVLKVTVPKDEQAARGRRIQIGRGGNGEAAQSRPVEPGAPESGSAKT